MQFFVYGRDRPGSFPLKLRLSEEHWSFLDSYDGRLVARGPTLTDDGAESTGSLHIVDLPDAGAACTFAYDEPYHRAGVFASVLLCRFVNITGRTMDEFTGAVENHGRFLVLAMGDPHPAPAVTRHMIVCGDLLALDDDTRLGRAALLEAPDRRTAAAALPMDGPGRPEVLPWRVGGRPAPSPDS